MLRAPLFALCLVAISAPAAAADLPSWLADRPDDAAWLQGGTEQAPRALVKLEDNDLEVVLWVPDLTPAGIASSVYTYDVYKRTEQVETSFEADGAFFTGTRVLGNFSPSVTANSKQIGGDSLIISWRLMPQDDAVVWLQKHRKELEASIIRGGLDETVDDYLSEIEDRLHVLAHVEGSHEFSKGFYRYHQKALTKSRAIQGIVNTLGKGPQMAAGLKAACYSIGKHTWAGAQGKKGVEFEVRGTSNGDMRPGK